MIWDGVVVWVVAIVQLVCVALEHDDVLIIGGRCGGTKNVVQVYGQTARELHIPGLSVHVATAAVRPEGSDEVWIVGGITARGNVSDLTQLFNLHTQRARPVHDSRLNVARAYHTVVSFSTLLFACGGWNEREKFLVSCERLHVGRATWRLLARAMPQPRSHHAAVKHGDYALLVGGTNYDQISMSDVRAARFDGEKLDWSLKEWRIPVMSVGRILPVAAVVNYPSERSGPSAALVVCGGYGLLGRLNSCELLPNLEIILKNFRQEVRWLELASLVHPRFGSFMVLDHDRSGKSTGHDRLLIGGGKASVSSGSTIEGSLLSVEQFDVVANRTTLLDLPLARACHFAVAIPLPPSPTQSQNPISSHQSLIVVLFCLHIAISFSFRSNTHFV